MARTKAQTFDRQRAVILDAAALLFATKGFRGASRSDAAPSAAHSHARRAPKRGRAEALEPQRKCAAPSAVHARSDTPAPPG